ncbi:MAG: hypothetical protein J2P48_15860 [Alphaproteobacteria bacterium]|nr:hypothetical protein [Alphaproteobacteria bacterium]
MALFDDLVSTEILSAEILGVNVVTGLAIGVALVVMPLAAPVLRPIAKATIKGGIYAYNSAAELYNQAASGVTDLAGEVQRELSTTPPAASALHRGRATTGTG